MANGLQQHFRPYLCALVPCIIVGIRKVPIPGREQHVHDAFAAGLCGPKQRAVICRPRALLLVGFVVGLEEILDTFFAAGPHSAGEGVGVEVALRFYAEHVDLLH